MLQKQYKVFNVHKLFKALPTELQVGPNSDPKCGSCRQTVIFFQCSGRARACIFGFGPKISDHLQLWILEGKRRTV